MIHKLPTYTLILSLLATSALAESAYTPSHKPLKPRVEANWRHSNDRSILMTEFWVPVAQNEMDGSVVYGDLRLMGDNASNREFNIGAGYRKMVETTLLGEGIAGAHIWYDRRFTKRGSKFNQVTAGMEWFGDVWDAKLNGYLPLNDSKNHTQGNPNGSGIGFAGSQIVVNTDQSVVEEALPGLDLELGWKVPFLDNVTDSTRVYVGGYHFEGDRADDVTGWRARVASDVTSDIQIGARFQRDDERGSQAFVEATIRFPFGNKQSYKQKGLRARLDESPERDIDIVSGEAITDQGIGEILLNAVTGDIQNVIHVDNTAAGGGDGSVETPFNTLAAAEGAAGTNDLIYLHRGDGTIAGQNAGILLDDEGQMLVGAGSSLTYSSGRFGTSNGLDATEIIIPADPLGTPVITNGAGSGAVVTADGTFLSGFTVDGAVSHGIYGINNSGTAWTKGMTVENTISQNNGVAGIAITTPAAGSTIENIWITNNVIDNNGFVGFQATGSLGQVNIANNISQNNFGTGFNILALVGKTITNATLTNNTSDNNSIGFTIDADVGVIERATLTGNIAKNNTGAGFFARARNASSLLRVDFTNNTAQNNIGDGFLARADGAGSTLNTATFTNNTADTNGAHGFYAYALNGGSVGQANFTSNTSQNNTFYGFRGEAVGASNLGIDLTNNTAATNTIMGFYMAGAGTSTVVGTLSGNTADNNGNHGIRVRAQDNAVTTYTLSDNIAINNNNSGIYVQSQNDGNMTSTLNNNLILNNNRGLWLQNRHDATMSSVLNGNTVTGNTNNGVYIDDTSTGVLTVDMGGGMLGSTAANRVYSNGIQELYVDLDGGNLKAENNWWGSDTGLAPAELDIPDASTVDTTPFLTTDPEL